MSANTNSAQANLNLNKTESNSNEQKSVIIRNLEEVLENENENPIPGSLTYNWHQSLLFYNEAPEICSELLKYL